MADLRAMAARLDFAEPRTLLQTGNLVFRAEPNAAQALAARLEAATARDLDLPTIVLVRSAADWRALIAGNPFAEMADADPAHLLVMALRGAPAAESEARLQGAIVGPERVAVRGDIAYLTYPDGIGRSKLTGKVIERHLDTVGTARNWTTAVKIAALLEG